MSWTEVSPDLTRDDDEKQGPGGGPITNEGAGGEIYGTLSYVAESPHDAGTIWTGSDDGIVHVTRDGGASWANVTPPDIGEAMINAIEVSPHVASAAYIAVTKYKFNDFTPLAFKTENFGETWTWITDGVADEAWVRVVREDPKRRGLLYMGTETGMYVSFDDGGAWQSLQLNLPVVPITDLIVQRRMNDLVASTQGRSFWILDDLSPLQQGADGANGGVRLFASRPAYRVQQGGGFTRRRANLGTNPPEGAIIDFVLDEVNDETTETIAKLELFDERGQLVRSYASDATGEDEDDASRLDIEAGANRTSWDLRHETPKKVAGAYIFGSLRGRKVVPGTYRVRLTVNDEAIHEQSIEVRKDPRLETTLAQFREQDAFLERLENEISEIHESVTRIRDVRGRIEEFISRTDGHDVVTAAGEALVTELTEIEDALIQKRTVDGQTVINFPSRLNHHFIYLRGAADGSEVGLIEGAEERFGDLMAQWAVQRSALNELFGPKLASFNALVMERGIPFVSGECRW